MLLKSFDYPPSEALGRLVDPLVQGLSATAYARQVPHHGAGFFEAFPREYNYPPTSHVRSLKDLSKYGVYTFFCSDSCAAYTNAALDAVGGFPRVLLGEDWRWLNYLETITASPMWQRPSSTTPTTIRCGRNSAATSTPASPARTMPRF